MIYVALPAFNEARVLGALAEAFAEDVAGKTPEPIHMAIVNDGSSDDTIDVVKGLAERYRGRYEIVLVNHPRNLGLAAAIRTGLTYCAKHAAGTPRDVVVTMDADNTHPPALTLRMVQAVREGADVVIASRYRLGARVVGLNAPRRFISWGARMFFRALFPIAGVRDYTCGYRVYRRPVLQSALAKYGEGFVSEKGFSCMVDILLKLRGAGLIFSELPMILRYDRKVGASKMKVLRTIRDTLRLALRRKFLPIAP